MKYSDYANDIVLADMLSYLLLGDSQKVVFLNNSNMEGVGQKLKRLIVEIETEMEDINQQQQKLSHSAAHQTRDLINN